MREKHAVYIGRFQPFHRGHLAVVKQGLELAEHLTIVVGSAHAAPTVKNPWSFHDRKTMIEASIEAMPRREKMLPWRHRVHVVPVRDYYYNENAWLADVQSKTAQIGVDHQEGGVLLLGNYKDGSSYYLKSFPQWKTTPIDAPSMDATAIRKVLFDRRDVVPNYEGKSTSRPDITAIAELLPGPVFQLLNTWTGTEIYCTLVQEYRHLKKYREAWESSPYPPSFVTTDAVVTCSGHVLVVRRKFYPGKGLFALPGGFIKEDETIKEGMLRELREETRIRLDKLILESEIVGSRVFDHPERSLRGRTISHGFHIHLRDGLVEGGGLPEIRAADDAESCFWMPLMDVARYEDAFFEDHAHIINAFVGAQGER